MTGSCRRRFCSLFFVLLCFLILEDVVGATKEHSGTNHVLKRVFEGLAKQKNQAEDQQPLPQTSDQNHNEAILRPMLQGLSLPSLPSSSLELISLFDSDLLSGWDQILSSGQIFFHSRGVMEYMPIWRLQLQTHTCDKDGAEPGAAPRVVLTRNNDPLVLNLASERGSTSRGSWYMFDLTASAGVALINDLEKMVLTVESSSGWCVDQVRLFVNDAPMPLYSESNEVWIDQEHPLVRDRTTLRKNAEWYISKDRQAAWFKAPAELSSLTMIEMVETLTGHHIAFEKQIRWGRLEGTRHVQVSYVDENTLMFTLDLKTTRTAFDPQVIVEVKMALECNNDNDGVSRLKTEIVNVHAEVEYKNTWQEIWSLGEIFDISYAIENKVERSLARNAKLSLPVFTCPRKVRVVSTPEGAAVRFVWDAPTTRIFDRLGALALALAQ